MFVEEFFELNKNVQRNHIPEANILFGIMLERIYHIAFLISHEYYPWRTHLDWAFRNLSVDSGYSPGQFWVWSLWGESL